MSLLSEDGDQNYPGELNVHRRFVRPGQIGYFERILIVEIEHGLDVQFAGVILVAVLRKERT